VFNTFVVAGPAALLYIARDKVRIDYKKHLKSFLFACVPFIVWDMWAASNGHWGFNAKYVAGPYLFGLPFEEILFFVTVPFAMIFIWELLVGTKNKVKSTRAIKLCMRVVLLASLVLAVGLRSRAYSRSVLLVLAFTMLALEHSKLYVCARFWRFQLWHLLVFVLSNSLLTALPIITYSSSAIVGYRLGTIPLEDFAYSFCLISVFVIVYNKASREQQRS
jgi:lycopene cyclase domain-containing protein